MILKFSVLGRPSYSKVTPNPTRLYEKLAINVDSIIHLLVNLCLCRSLGRCIFLYLTSCTAWLVYWLFIICPSPTLLYFLYANRDPRPADFSAAIPREYG